MQIQTSTSEMIKDLKEVKSIFSNSEQSADSKSFDPLAQQQMQLELAMRLQMSLETEWVLQQFMEITHSYLLFDGYRYQLKGAEVEIEQGRQKGHNCSYNLSLESDLLGELKLYRGRKFVESELVLLENLLVSLLFPLRNSLEFRKARQAAHYDALTGAMNRSNFDNSLAREVSLAQRHKNQFSMLVVDIDHFKQVNDTYGHSTGDEVLKQVAKALQENIRATDLLYRYGGEEFVIMLSNSDCEASSLIADRILDCIRETNIVCKDEKINVSVSIGLSCLKRADTPESLFDRADTALYTAKDEGRDQVKIA